MYFFNIWGESIQTLSVAEKTQRTVFCVLLKVYLSWCHFETGERLQSSWGLGKWLSSVSSAAFIAILFLEDTMLIMAPILSRWPPRWGCLWAASLLEQLAEQPLVCPRGNSTSDDFRDIHRIPQESMAVVLWGSIVSQVSENSNWDSKYHQWLIYGQSRGLLLNKQAFTQVCSLLQSF